MLRAAAGLCALRELPWRAHLLHDSLGDVGISIRKFCEYGFEQFQTLFPGGHGKTGFGPFRGRDGAIYVNTARAALHDLDALTDALASGKLSAAALDHFEGEQLPAGHPLAEMPNVVLTPHIGGATYDTESNHTSMLAADIRRLLGGERPVHCVNPEVL